MSATLEIENLHVRVEGFFAEVLEEVPLEGLRKTLQQAIAAKIEE